MYKMGRTELSNDTIKEQAVKAGYEEISAFDNMRLAFMKRNRFLVIYKDGSVEGGAL